MTATLDDLEKRLATLEQEVAWLRQLMAVPPPEEGGLRHFGNASPGQAPLTEGWVKAMERMGIRGQPIGAEKVQEMMAACGIRPEENAFSRGIIEMREE